ncbi:BON1-associated protein 1 isoform X1 [Raphanus sativus]|uniref:BON1-associated protein 1 isoform X1 n=1 Tax=Raphanus sativus TaxID=3726 RepID=A0A6J0N795_RAPSA|nr:BON1-associated protein 1 isoform X1 [Raphanus sativus]
MIYLGRINPLFYTTMTKTLEIDIRSAEGLKINRRLIKKKKTFAVARIGDKSRKTYLDDSGGSNPTWNFKSEMPMQGSVKFISIEVFYRTRCGRDKKIGEAPIPATDFMGKYSHEGHLNFLTYRLRDEYGDKCGIVNVSIVVKPDSTETTMFMAPSSSSSEPPSIDGYGGRIVTGVPVWRLTS